MIEYAAQPDGTTIATCTVCGQTARTTPAAPDTFTDRHTPCPSRDWPPPLERKGGMEMFTGDYKARHR